MQEVPHQRGADPLPTESRIDRHLFQMTVAFSCERERNADSHFTSSRNMQQIGKYRFSKECIAARWIVRDVRHSCVAKQRPCSNLECLQRSDVADISGPDG